MIENPPRTGREEKPDIELLEDIVVIASTHHTTIYGTDRINALRRAIATLREGHHP